ncbi:MAG: RNase adapter RapZ [Proteobacteria bacterium]|nr:MAG: RNase adapter RapZ [Pseudomonadota bacterium]
MHVLIITGMSGAGKTQALNTLEDQDYYCIDNLPLNMLQSLFDNEWLKAREKIAVGVDVRGGKNQLESLPEIVQNLKSRFNADLVYLYASKDILFKRYNETRRKHPLSNDGMGLGAAIRAEYELLTPVRAIADFQLETSDTNIYQLAILIKQHICVLAKKQLSLSFQSFGFKYGAPRDSDFIYDVRCLPNPYWIPELRKKSGQTEAVSSWLDSQALVQEMYLDIRHFLEKWIPSFIENQRAYLTLSIGCTGGHHRSVYLIDKLATYFRQNEQISVIVNHREIAPKNVQ